MLKRAAINKLFERIRVGGFKVIWWDGEKKKYGNGKVEFTLHIKDPSVINRLVKNTSLGFAESYMEGLIDIEGDPHDVVAITHRNKKAFPEFQQRSFRKLMRGVTLGASLKQSKRDIADHYDLGNDFYKLWLDKEMQYTCAYFPNKKASLEQAQLNKMEHVGRKLLLKPGMKVVEVGCGWGGLSLHLAKKFKVKIKAFNISHEQIIYARERAKREKLDKLVEFIEDDYRNANFTCDRFVSVGIYEHVGRPNHPKYFETVQRLLKPGGVSVLHTITTEMERPTDPWIGKYIFPGGYIPSWREVVNIMPEYNMHLTDTESLRMHYAMTLDEWAKRFERHVNKIRAERDEKFIRMWRLYLRASAASFRFSGLDLHQFVFTHELNNDLPLTRAYLYK
jgi:cyclopropane-fatty-acyl-phospholipid synthase